MVCQMFSYIHTDCTIQEHRWGCKTRLCVWTLMLLVHTQNVNDNITIISTTIISCVITHYIIYLSDDINSLLFKMSNLFYDASSA